MPARKTTNETGNVVDIDGIKVVLDPACFENWYLLEALTVMNDEDAGPMKQNAAVFRFMDLIFGDTKDDVMRQLNEKYATKASNGVTVLDPKVIMEFVKKVSQKNAELKN